MLTDERGSEDRAYRATGVRVRKDRIPSPRSGQCYTPLRYRASEFCFTIVHVSLDLIVAIYTDEVRGGHHQRHDHYEVVSLIGNIPGIHENFGKPRYTPSSLVHGYSILLADMCWIG